MISSHPTEGANSHERSGIPQGDVLHILKSRLESHDPC